MNKNEFLQQLDQEWQALLHSYLHLPEGKASEPCGVGAWSVKDILGHMTTWEVATIENLGLMMQGAPLREDEDFETYNQEEIARKAPLSLAEIERQLHDTHQRLLAALNTVPEDRWASDTQMQEHVLSETSNHCIEHSEQIREWRTGQGL